MTTAMTATSMIRRLTPLAAVAVTILMVAPYVARADKSDHVEAR